jgi:DNA-binding phage protein
MARRSRDWNEGLAKDLKNQKFAHEYILACIEEGMSLQEILGKIARTVGVKEFAAMVKMPSSNVLRSVNPESNLTQDTLDRLLKPFGLKLTVAPIAPKIKKVA